MATVRRELHYVKTFELKYKVRFGLVHTKTISQGLAASEFLPKAYLSTNRRIVRVAKFFERHPSVLAFGSSTAGFALGVTHIDNHGARCGRELCCFPTASHSTIRLKPQSSEGKVLVQGV